MRSSRFVVVPAVFAALTVGLGGAARAEDQVDLQAFKPSAFGNGFFVTDSGDTLDKGSIDAGLWLHYQHDPLVYRDSTGAISRTVVGNQMTAELTGSYAFFDWLNLGVAVPTVVYQDGDGDVGQAKPGFFGVGDIRIVPKVRAYKMENNLLAVSVLPEVTLSTGRFFDKYMGDPLPTFVPTVAVSTSTRWVDASLNASYLFRFNTTLDQYSIRDEIGARLAASVHVFPTLSIVGEAYGATQAFRPFEDPGQLRAELMGGVRALLPANLTATVGVGGNPAKGIGTPDFRVFANVAWALRPPKDKDGDGIDDPLDKCPDAAEDKDGFQDDDGCPDVDNDGDGVPDSADKCPDEKEDPDGYQDADGCPDLDNDGDGIPDSADGCPNIPETKNGYQDTDGCPDDEPDSDGDGILDKDDKCPTQAEDKDGFEDDDGCPDTDNDKDGVVDEHDKCPNEPGVVENHGCPDSDKDGDGVVDRLDNCPDEKGSADNHGCKKKQLVVITKEKLQILDKVYFDTGKTTIRKRSFALLQNVADVMKSHPDIAKVRVEGHTDSVGKDEANKKLSQGRAEAVRAFLVKAGVPETRLDAVGYGEEKPVETNDTAKGRAANRRVEFTILQ